MPNFSTINSIPINADAVSSITYNDTILEGVGVDDTHGMFRPSATYSDSINDGILVDDTHELFRIPTTYTDVLSDSFELTHTQLSHIVSIFDDILADTFTLSDTVVGHIQSTFIDVLADTFTLTDTVEQRGQLTFVDTLLELQNMSETVQGTASALVLEAIALTQSEVSNVSIGLIESLTILHTSVWGVGVIVPDGLTVSSQISLQDVFGIVEGILIAQSITYPTSFKIQAEEIVTLADSLLLLISELVSEGINLIHSEALTLEQYMELREAVLLNHSDLTTATLNILVANLLTLTDHISLVAFAEVSEEVYTLSDDVVATYISHLSILEAIEVMVAQEGKLIISVLAEDTFDLNMLTSTSMAINNSLMEGVQFVVSYDDGKHTYMGITMAPESFGITEYDNYNFTDIALFGDMYLMSSPSGLYKMGGSLDESEYITSRVKTASVDFDTSNIKQVPKVYLGIDNDASLMLRVHVDGTLGATYQLDLEKDNLSTQMIDIGKGLKGRYWQFDLQTKENTQFNLDEIELYPITFGRKI